MRATLRYILLCALRDKLFAGMLAAILLCGLVAGVLGRAAFLEEHAMMITLAAAGARFVLAVGISVFVCFQVRGLFDSREMDVMLSRPLSRPKLLLALACGFASVATLLCVPVIVMIGLMGIDSGQGFTAWSLSLVLEGMFVASFALFASLILRSAATAVLMTLGFYVVSRMMVFFVMTAESVRSGGLMMKAARWAVESVSVVMPRLDMFAKSEWLVYPATLAQDFSLFLLQAAIYIPFVLIAAMLDFQRKQC